MRFVYNNSPVHDHAESHCFMKIMKGTLRETKYEWPKQKNAPMETKERTEYKENVVAYINSKILRLYILICAIAVSSCS